MMYASAPLFGKIYDNYGPRPLLLFGTAAHVLGLMMASLSEVYYQFFLAQSICSALGAAAIFYAGNNPVGTWFMRNRALAFGIVSTGASVSGILLPYTPHLHMFCGLIPPLEAVCADFSKQDYGYSPAASSRIWVDNADMCFRLSLSTLNCHGR